MPTCFAPRFIRLVQSAGGQEKLMPPETHEGMRQLTKLLKAMTCVENGCRMKDVPVREIARGYRLAFRTSDKWHRQQAA